MVFAGVLGSSVRSTLKLAGQRLVPQVSCQSQLSNARLFSVLLQQSSRSGIHRLPILAVTSRSITKTAVQPTATVPSTPADAASASAVTPPEAVIPDVVTPESSVELLPDLLDSAISHLPAALQYGDLAALGLVGWTPAGFIRWSLELINVTTGMPWFWTIVAGSLFWKAVLFPLAVKGLQNSARILPIQPQLQKCQEEMSVVQKSGDKLAMQKQALKLRKLYNDAGVSMGATFLIPFIQFPVTLGMFFGVKKMCDLPVEQLTQSGLDLLPNLAVPDPYMILPILLCAAVNTQISVGAAELNLTDRPEMGHIMNGLRLLSVAGIWVMSAFPSGLMISLVTTSFATTVQSLLLQQPSIRRALNIPIVPAQFQGKLPSPLESVQYVIAKYTSKLSEASAAAKQPQAKNRRR
ncbi:Mitochondrial inner membrane protein OXA1L [Hypsizygus marmoreus]|uniref:Mitochondrial inner membrane protein OXA1L n=1 Tax=Hypsizygus marmoreus TaxID=39966 RepID=A0A369JBH5_HYPMA|nr:Mitochondrial inner membrane protein OXA1L [Hypsizygus marmoreus]